MRMIFVSYSRTDVEAVEKLVANLEEAGHDVWRDREVVGGQDWWATIISQIRARDVFIVALSAASLDSPACAAELTYAGDLHKHLLPVRVATDFRPAAMNSTLARTQMIDYCPPTVAGVIRLMRAIHDLPAAVALTGPEPVPPPAPLSYLTSLRDRLDRTVPLTEAEQGELVLTLRRNCRNPEEVDEAKALLKAVRARPELYARYADDIDETLRRASPSVAPPTAATPTAATPTAATPNADLVVPAGSSRRPRRHRGSIALGVAGFMAVAGIGSAVALQNRDTNPPGNSSPTEPDTSSAVTQPETSSLGTSAPDPDLGWVDAADQACRDHLPSLTEIIDNQSSTAFAEMADVVGNLSSALDQLEGTPDLASDVTNNLNGTVERYFAAQDLTDNGSSDEAANVGAEGFQLLVTALTQLGSAGATDCAS